MFPDSTIWRRVAASFPLCVIHSVVVTPPLGRKVGFNYSSLHILNANTYQACRGATVATYLKMVSLNKVLQSVLAPRDPIHPLVYQPFVQRSAFKRARVEFDLKANWC